MNVSSELQVKTCPVCFVLYAAPERLFHQRHKDGESFFCPNGHSLTYKDNEHDLIRRERDKLKQDQAWYSMRLGEEADARAKAEKELKASTKVVKKLETRASAGVCPCCTRTFTNMARHMRTKHPEFKAIGVAS